MTNPPTPIAPVDAEKHECVCGCEEFQHWPENSSTGRRRCSGLGCDCTNYEPVPPAPVRESQPSDEELVKQAYPNAQEANCIWDGEPYKSNTHLGCNWANARSMLPKAAEPRAPLDMKFNEDWLRKVAKEEEGVIFAIEPESPKAEAPQPTPVPQPYREMLDIAYRSGQLSAPLVAEAPRGDYCPCWDYACPNDHLHTDPERVAFRSEMMARTIKAEAEVERLKDSLKNLDDSFTFRAPDGTLVTINKSDAERRYGQHVERIMKLESALREVISGREVDVRDIHKLLS